MIQVQTFEVLSSSECTFIVECATPKLTRSTVRGSGTRVVSTIRTSYDCLLSLEDFPPATHSRLVEATCKATSQPPSHVEQLRAIRYEKGEYYRDHRDWFVGSYEREFENGGQRLYSAVLCLQEPELGGELVFPALDLSLKLVVGQMAIWNNLVNGVPSASALHRSDPVVTGTKWSLVTWVRERPTRVSRKGDKRHGGT